MEVIDEKLYIKIPDKNFESSLVTQKIGDKLLRSRVKNVTGLVIDECCGLWIKTLSGIEIFEDLEGISINTAQLEDEEIDLSKNKKMWNFQIRNAPNLKRVDFSEFSNMKYCLVMNTSVEEIDTKNNKQLSTFYFLNSKLKSIDLSNNPYLTSIDLSNNEPYRFRTFEKSISQHS